jgi:hypothetical protein
VHKDKTKHATADEEQHVFLRKKKKQYKIVGII